ncbi:hypothetical protein, partial [Flavobacterium sp.]|uniref:hypothetical protein n=1 Tax=Flavobacterium sp. TaxID=239 RepID=UPI002EDA618C
MPLSIFFTSIFKNITAIYYKELKILNDLEVNDFNLLLLISINVVLVGFVFSVLGIYYSWTKKFESHFIPMIEKKL